MKYQNYSQLVRAFFRNEAGEKVRVLQTEDRGDSIALIHHQSVLAEYHYESRTMHLNITHYGVHSDRIQRLIKMYISYANTFPIDHIIEYDNQKINQLFFAKKRAKKRP